MSEEDSLEGLLDPPATSLLISTTLREKGRGGVGRRRESAGKLAFAEGKNCRRHVKRVDLSRVRLRDKKVV